MFSSNQSNVAASVVANYIEDVFSTYLYTGNGSTQTITNDIDLSGKGGLTWIKYRDGIFGGGHYLYDTVRGAGKVLQSNLTNAESAADDRFISFNSNGFSLATTGGSALNASTYSYVSWTFREQAKFFDVVTYTGTGGVQNISHNLGSVPACIIVKRTDTTANWVVYHTSLGNAGSLILNTTAAADTASSLWNSTTPTSTQFTVNSGNAQVGGTGGTCVAYLFAHNAGGFGLAGTDNVISCGLATPNPATYEATVNLGWEPQWVLTRSTAAGNWMLTDNMRGMTVFGSNDSILQPNKSDAEYTTNSIGLTSTGFITQSYGTDFIYIAIRRGPMKVPTLGTSVFAPVTRTGTGATATGTAGFAPDLIIPVNRPHDYTGATPFFDKLRGSDQAIYSNATTAEETRASTLTFSNTGVTFGTNAIANSSGASYINWYLQRAPSFFDEVCYTGTGVARTVTHNLTVAPELMIFKSRSDVRNWQVYSSTLGATKNLRLNAADGEDTNTYWNNTAPTASVFSIDSSIVVNASASTFVAYLFATCAGVSKVGSYTGNGTTQTINCGFGAGGARFVLIKRTDASGDWYVYDTARGMTVLTDPYLLLNSTAAEVATLGSVTTVSTGFALNSTILAAINVNAGTYIFLAIA